jgi:hypothetical protein
VLLVACSTDARRAPTMVRADTGNSPGRMPDAGFYDSAQADVQFMDASSVDSGQVPDAGNDTFDAATPPSAPARVLFIGNSFTYFNGGLEKLVRRLRESVDGAPRFETEAEVQGGASLQVMWESTDARDRIENGNYDIVVLQEDIPETNVDSFHRHARLFNTAIRNSGARPVLFMAWAYDRLGWISMAEIAQAHRTIAAELAIDVAPVGLAWQRSDQQDPTLDMYGNDDEHPSIHGSYLAACVIYGTIFSESPVGLSYRPSRGAGVSEDEAAFLQQVAWDEIQAQ